MAKPDGGAPIAIFIPSFRGGGAEGSMVRLANSLVAVGVRVDLVVLQAEGTWQDLVDGQVRIVDLHQQRALLAMQALHAYLRSDPRVFISNLPHLNLISIIVSRFLSRRPPVVVIEHNDMHVFLQSFPAIFRAGLKKLYQHAYPRAERVLAVSADLGGSIASILDLPAEKMGVLYNGLDSSQIHTAAQAEIMHPWFENRQTPVLVNAGRFVAQKGQDILLEAMAIAKERMPIRLILLGDGPMKQGLIEQAQQLGIEELVDFAGFHSNPYPYLRQADAFVLSSRYEGFAIVVLEAMICGTPVLATDCHWGPAEILERGMCGSLVAVEDASALANGILEMLNNPAQMQVYVRESKRRAADFSIEAMRDTILALVSEIEN